MKNATSFITDIPCPVCNCETALITKEKSIWETQTTIHCERCGFGSHYYHDVSSETESDLIRKLNGSYYTELQRIKYKNSIEELLKQILKEIGN